ncbi:hypothetical protein AGOR_G00238250 [Albula goreensis]|uniref:Uncharacterized protein n=1 Tax=Albula goreensis TaxID=1534307 RepID=A0A8T3CFX2_9TELE|nr:hypothetical protein AGOR_G00238250 [Albula goreensis]
MTRAVFEAATAGHTAVRLAPLSLVTIVTDPIHPCASWVRCLKTRRGETALQVEGGRASADRRQWIKRIAHTTLWFETSRSTTSPPQTDG